MPVSRSIAVTNGDRVQPLTSRELEIAEFGTFPGTQPPADWGQEAGRLAGHAAVTLSCARRDEIGGLLRYRPNTEPGEPKET